MTKQEQRTRLRSAGLGFLAAGILLAVSALAATPAGANSQHTQGSDHGDRGSCQVDDHGDESGEEEPQAALSNGSDIQSDDESCPTATTEAPTTTTGAEPPTTRTALVLGAVVTQTTTALTTSVTALGVDITPDLPRTGSGSTLQLGQASVACIGIGLVLLTAARMSAEPH